PAPATAALLRLRVSLRSVRSQAQADLWLFCLPSPARGSDHCRPRPQNRPVAATTSGAALALDRPERVPHSAAPGGSRVGQVRAISVGSELARALAIGRVACQSPKDLSLGCGEGHCQLARLPHRVSKSLHGYTTSPRIQESPLSCGNY